MPSSSDRYSMHTSAGRRRRSPGPRARKALKLEALEPRRMLVGDLVINEFVASNSAGIVDGDGLSSDWIEVHNPTTVAVDVTGWHLTDDALVPDKWPFPSRTLAPNEYLIVFASGQSVTNHVDSLGYLHTNFKLAADGEYLGLSDAQGATVHEFAPQFPRQTTDIAYGLNAAGESVFFTTPTPGSANDEASAVDSPITITEIMYHPTSEDVAEEFIEIYNRGSVAVNLDSWSLEGGIQFDFGAMTLSPGAYLAVAADVATFSLTYPTVTNVVGGWEGKLSNQTDSLRLVNDLGITVDDVRYADSGDWATRERGPLDRGHEGWVWSDDHDGGGRSLELVQTELTNRIGLNWMASTPIGGTPGLENSVSVADTAPLIVQTAHAPSIPGSTDSVVVTTRLIDELETGVSATLWWRVDGEAAFSNILMTDDGQGSDATLGDGVFTAVIPAQPDGTIVEWYVAATDAALNVRTWPSASLPDGLQETNLLYQVDDAFDPAMLPLPGERWQYKLIMTEAERAELEEIGSGSSIEARTNAQMNGTFIAVTPGGIDVRYNVGLRNRGNGSRDNLPNNIRVNIPSDRPWKGIDQFNLNTQHTHLQLAGLRLYEAAGLPVSEARPVTVQVNGTNLAEGGSPAYGVYIQIEAHNSDFASNHFPEDANGNLYRGTHEGSFNGDLSYEGPDPSDYAGPYIKKTNESEDDWADIIHLTDVLNNTSDADYIKELEKAVDIDNWLGYFAMIASLGTNETMLGTGYGDDYLVYMGNNDPRAVLIPHDFDAILGSGESQGDPLGSIHRATRSPAIERFLTHPDIAPRYHARLLDLMETVFEKEPFDAMIDELITDIAPAEIQDIKDFMDARRTFIASEVTRELTVASALPSVGGFQTTTQDHVGLTGTTPLASSRSIVVDGQLAELDPFTGVWSYGQTEGGMFVSIMDTPYVWHYLDAGQEPPAPVAGADWRVDDPGWADSGPSPLGYGDSKVTTNVEYIDTDPDRAGVQKNFTTYYRTTFDLENVSEFTALTIELQLDDGAIAYLNGVEVVRSNMPAGPVSSTTPAPSSTASETQFFPYAIDPTLLVEGTNVLAVELHQVSESSSDTILDARMYGTRGMPSSLDGVSLQPGINRIEVLAYDGIDGTGNLVDQGFIDIWQNNGNTTAVNGPLTTNTTWTAANSPYVVSSDLDITAGTLTIEPGVTVFLDAGVAFNVSGDGQVLAEGTADAPIRFTRNPLTGGGNWDGLNFTNTLADNRFVHVEFQSGDAQGKATDIAYSRVLFDHVTWSDVNAQILDMVHPTLIVRNSHIPAISNGETIHLVGLDVGEQLVFENNIIGKNTSGGDVVDMAPDSLNRQTIYFTNNTFLGGLDDGVDTDGNIVIFEGNTFRDFHYNTSRTTTSNAISSGHQNVGDTRLSSDLTIRNNTFYDVDHALLLKDFSEAVFEYNTVVRATVGAIQLQELAGSNVVGPGLGVSLESNIFTDSPVIFEATHEDTVLTVNRSILPNQEVPFGDAIFFAHDLGVGNFDADPLLADPSNGDFSLTEGSPAFLAGLDEQDIGAIQAPRYTAASSANLQITELHYHPLAGGLGAQASADCEVPADGDWFEFVELFNYSDETIDLSNAFFGNGIDYQFPWGTTLAPGERILIVKDQDVFASRYGTGLPVVGQYDGKLSNSGETVLLQSAAGEVIADITYGDANVAEWPQAADGSGASLELVQPGDPNVDYSAPTSWRNGADGGTPGTVNVQLPCDYVDAANGCDIDDIDALYAGTHGAPGPLSDGLISQWLNQASDVANPRKADPGHVYRPGDTNLDGRVDSIDLGVLLNSFNDASGLGWGRGNLNSDAVVNSTDLGILLNSFGFQSDAPPATDARQSSPDASGTALDTQTIDFTFQVIEDEEEDDDQASSQLVITDPS